MFKRLKDIILEILLTGLRICLAPIVGALKIIATGCQKLADKLAQV